MSMQKAYRKEIEAYMQTAPPQSGWAAFVTSLISFHVKERFLSQAINVK